MNHSKLKCVFIDRYHPRFQTFSEYNFDAVIKTRFHELFGWSTILRISLQSTLYEMTLHIISEDYLLEHGVTQHFYSRHGPSYDDKYSYLHGLNLLTFEGRSRTHTIYVIRRIMEIISTQKTVGTRRDKRASILDQKSYTIPVDTPRLGILTHADTLEAEWVYRVSSLGDSIRVSDDIRTLIPDISPTDFIEYSLSRNYTYSLIDYIPCFQQVLEII